MNSTNSTTSAVFICLGTGIVIVAGVIYIWQARTRQKKYERLWALSDEVNNYCKIPSRDQVFEIFRLYEEFISSNLEQSLPAMRYYVQQATSLIRSELITVRATAHSCRKLCTHHRETKYLAQNKVEWEAKNLLLQQQADEILLDQEKLELLLRDLDEIKFSQVQPTLTPISFGSKARSG